VNCSWIEPLQNAIFAEMSIALRPRFCNYIAIHFFAFVLNGLSDCICKDYDVISGEILNERDKEYIQS